MNEKQIKRDKTKNNNREKEKKVYAIENVKTTHAGGIEHKLTKANNFRERNERERHLLEPKSMHKKY